jgi:hypothetical protein
MASSRVIGGLAGLALAASAVAVTPAFANGGDFFEELSATWNSAHADEGVPYFGFIKDTKGKGIAGAAVSATTASGSTFFVQSDNMGHYRIPGFSKSVDAKLVQINCAKTGYKLLTRDRRIMRFKADGPVETNCVLAPDNSAKPTS